MTFWDYLAHLGGVGIGVIILVTSWAIANVVGALRKRPTSTLETCPDELCILVHQSHDELLEEDKSQLYQVILNMRATARQLEE